jgi:hypothetical protein
MTEKKVTKSVMWLIGMVNAILKKHDPKKRFGPKLTGVSNEY